MSTSPALAAGKRQLGSRVLREGMRGSDVKTLQSDLTKAGYRTPAIGIFGPITKGNVNRFARRHHLRANGVVTRTFVRRLKSAIRSASTVKTPKSAGAAPAPAAASTTNTLGQRTLQEGMSGPDVSQLQTDLSAAGYPTSVDGQFGPATKASVVSFQQANNLTADGVFTAADLPVLQNLDAAALASGPVARATLNSDGTVTAPAGAPKLVQDMIAAANSIISTPYVYGGGHGNWVSNGYDCSGAVSFALHGAGLLSSPEDSTELESYGDSGPGSWVTVYADAGHAFIVIAGLAFDTAHYGLTTPGGSGPRWLQPADVTANLSDGGNYIIRHPAGL